MAIPRSLGNDLFRYRRRKKRSLDGSVPGLAQSRFHKSRRYISVTPYVPRRGGYHHDIYNWGIPRDYHPSLNAPAIDWTEYDEYTPVDIRHISRPDNPKLPHELDDAAPAMPIPTSLPEDDLAHEEEFLMAMGQRDEIEQGALEESRFNINEPDGIEPFPVELQLPVEERSIEDLPSLDVLKDAFLQLSETLPEDHPDLVNVRTAMHKVLNHQISLSETNDADTSDPYNMDAGVMVDPIEHDPFQEAEQFFNKQMELFEKSFDESPMESFGIHSPVQFEGESIESAIMSDEPLPDEFLMEEQTLEQRLCEPDPFDVPAPGFAEQDMMPDNMVDDMNTPGPGPEFAIFDIDPAIDEINQAIDEVTQQAMPEEMEPDPFEQQQDPYMTGFDQMQYMVNPFGMPGPYGPMGPGPMGPMPGQMPGPMPGP
jgi:hypothetical protein